MTSRKRIVLEITAVLLTAAGKFVFMDRDVRLPFIITAILLWVIYILWTYRREPDRVRHWGFRKDNFATVFRILLPYAILSVLSCFVAGFAMGTINLSWHILPILLLYPLWGTIQQFLLISLVAGNLQDLYPQAGNKGKTIIIVSAAVLFGAVHYPFWWLVAGTFVLALLYGYVFLRERNIYVLGVFHGWLGALFFYTVVNRDPFAEVFGRYF